MSKAGHFFLVVDAILLLVCISLTITRMNVADLRIEVLSTRVTMLERDTTRLAHLFEQQGIINQALIERHIGPRRGDILFGVPVPAVPVTRVIGIKIKQQGVRIDAHQRPAKR